MNSLLEKERADGLNAVFSIEYVRDMGLWMTRVTEHSALERDIQNMKWCGPISLWHS